jgi:hypothetical protein
MTRFMMSVGHQTSSALDKPKPEEAQVSTAPHRLLPTPAPVRFSILPGPCAFTAPASSGDVAAGGSSTQSFPSATDESGFEDAIPARTETLAEADLRLAVAEFPDLCHPEGDRLPADLCQSDRFESLKLERTGITPQPTQSELWQKELHHFDSIVSKLDSLARHDLADKIRHCHSEKRIIECCGCYKRTVVYNRCDVAWCPICAPRLSFRRKERVAWWAVEIKQPKHVVLTVRNFERLDKKAVQTFKECWNKLRRRTFARDWKGGFYSLEVTNEGSGWHLHLHALIDCRFIPADELARQWASIVGQDFAIVKVKDCRREDYIREVTKYAVKGSELAAWTPQQIADFVTAFDGVRTFGVFGSLYGKQQEWRDFIDEQDSENARCACGCNTYRVMSENEAEWQDLMRTSPPARKNLRPDSPQLVLLSEVPCYQQPD